MTGQTTTEVRTGSPKAGGYAFVAPLGTTRPTVAGAALAVGYLDLGYISGDGIEVTTENSTEKIKDWNRDVIALVQDANECTLKLTLMQKSIVAAQELFGTANVTIDNTVPATPKITKISYDGALLPHRQFAFPLKDSNGDQVLDIGDGQIVGMAGFALQKNAVMSFETTIELFKDSSGKFFNLLSA